LLDRNELVGLHPRDRPDSDSKTPGEGTSEQLRGKRRKKEEEKGGGKRRRKKQQQVPERHETKKGENEEGRLKC